MLIIYNQYNIMSLPESDNLISWLQCNWLTYNILWHSIIQCKYRVITALDTKNYLLIVVRLAYPIRMVSIQSAGKDF